MIDFEKAQSSMLSVEPLKGTEYKDLDKCLGRVVAQSIPARIGLPPFAKSAMDGFAISSRDTSTSFSIIETIPAGAAPKNSVEAGSCSRIMTGAMMPQGADAVVRVEYTSEIDGRMQINTPETRSNVIEKDENVKPGETIFEPGVVEPQHIGIFAEQGIDKLPVRVMPIVGLITTGSELKDPGESLGIGEIYNSNGPQLCSQINAMGAGLKYYGIVEDTEDAVVSALKKASIICDVVLLTGGVSMGDYDFVPDAVINTGAEIVFHKVAVKPGKPLLFAKGENSYIIGLPGNPVSTFIIFEVMVKPMLYKLMGVEVETPTITGYLTEDIFRRDADRLEFRPVYQNGEKVSPISYHGSSHLRALSSANALLVLEVGVESVPKGTKVNVRPI